MGISLNGLVDGIKHKCIGGNLLSCRSKSDGQPKQSEGYLSMFDYSHWLPAVAFNSTRSGHLIEPKGRDFLPQSIQHLDQLRQTFGSSFTTLLYSRKWGRAENKWHEAFSLGIRFTTSRNGEVNMSHTN